MPHNTLAEPEVLALRAPKRRRIHRPILPRHELPWWRKCDMATGLNLSDSSGYRLRRLPGFPEPNALGLYSRAEVLAFVASLKREGSDTGASTSARNERGRFANRDDRAAEITSTESPGVASKTDGHIPPCIPKAATAGPLQSNEAPPGAASKAPRGKARRS